MDELIKQVASTIMKAIDRFGSKFLLALLSGVGLYYLADAGKVDGLYATAGIVVIAVTYFVFRRQQEKENGIKKPEVL